MTDSVWSIELEKHQTKDIDDKHINGTLTVVWRDWDSYIKTQPKMIYVSSVNPGERKGPHLHKRRTSYFVCIHGKVVFVIKDNEGKYVEIESSAEKPVLICVPKNIPSAHVNISNEVSRILVIADLAWRPDDNEMTDLKFEDYDWSKWKNQ
ncbi:MAG: WxcM-like domain-containing protein [Candidatus Nitrosotenuis sp.]